ncbi:hypothetical protein Bhyg_10480 [Pseudolycoriella hygida]|uniref:Uncharacterized protein n=1 Tax=Pseudolycoriella hygida TaxID=35572 RepID=A0A9Q0MV99_9DIPT|nr:hypothetical protein Bhyg_10480 [Pseudolycoriella hygida]
MIATCPPLTETLERDVAVVLLVGDSGDSYLECQNAY